MIRHVMLVLAVGCSSTSNAIDAHVDPAVCKANLEAAIDRTCAVPADCVLVDSADCCGVVKLGVKSGTQVQFPPVESQYVACLACGPRGCQHADQAEDGSVPSAGQSIVATCTAGRCTSIVQ